MSREGARYGDVGYVTATEQAPKDDGAGPMVRVTVRSDYNYNDWVVFVPVQLAHLYVVGARVLMEVTA